VNRITSQYFENRYKKQPPRHLQNFLRYFWSLNSFRKGKVDVCVSGLRDCGDQHVIAATRAGGRAQAQEWGSSPTPRPASESQVKSRVTHPTWIPAGGPRMDGDHQLKPGGGNDAAISILDGFLSSADRPCVCYIKLICLAVSQNQEEETSTDLPCPLV